MPKRHPSGYELTYDMSNVHNYTPKAVYSQPESQKKDVYQV